MLRTAITPTIAAVLTDPRHAARFTGLSEHDGGFRDTSTPQIGPEALGTHIFWTASISHRLP